MSETELKPCAHCGNQPHTDIDYQPSYVWIVCKCGIRTHQQFFETNNHPEIWYRNYCEAKQKCVEKWNQRA